MLGQQERSENLCRNREMKPTSSVSINPRKWMLFFSLQGSLMQGIFENAVVHACHFYLHRISFFDEVCVPETQERDGL